MVGDVARTIGDGLMVLPSVGLSKNFSFVLQISGCNDKTTFYLEKSSNLFRIRSSNWVLNVE